MPAPARYAPPHVQLRLLAEVALRNGIDFGEFWEQALRPDKPLVTRHREHPPDGCVIWPRDTFDRQNAIKAIVETREGWRRAYDGEPPLMAELALQALGPALEGFDPYGDVASPHGPEHAVAA